MPVDLYYWHYVPNKGANAFGVAITIVLLIAQAFFGIKYKQWLFFSSWCIALIMNLIGFIFRMEADRFESMSGIAWIVQYAFLLLSPTLLMLGVYYQMSKLIVIYGRHFIKCNPLVYTHVFTGIDVVCIVLQAIGGGLASSEGDHSSSGMTVAKVGVIVQLLGMAVFCFLFTVFLRRVWGSPEDTYEPAFQSARQRRRFPYLVPALYVCWTFIFARCLFRIAAMFNGWQGKLASKEWYIWSFDFAFVIVAIMALTFVHPGLAFGDVPVGVHHRDEKTRIPDEEEQDSSKSEMLKSSDGNDDTYA